MAAANRLVLRSFQKFDPGILDSSGLSGEQPRHLQLGRGALQGQADQIYFDKCALRIGALSQTVRVIVELPAERVTIGFVLDTAEPIRVLGRPLHAHELTLLGAGEALDVLFSPGSKWVTLNMPAADYAHELASISENSHFCLPRNAPRIRPQSAIARQLGAALSAVERFAHDQPGLFEDETWRANTERNVVNGIFGLIDSANLTSNAKGEVRLRTARRIVREAEEKLAGMATTPGIGALCRALRVPRRTLERSFRETLNLSPSEYLRIRALNAVRRELLMAEARPGAIARIAIDNGFWHLGRFAGAYRALFGERPFDTLRGGGLP
jgi:AraC-like DNA-binding protein